MGIGHIGIILIIISVSLITIPVFAQESEQIVCPQGFEPVNGKCPDKPVILSDQNSACDAGSELFNGICYRISNDVDRNLTPYYDEDDAGMAQLASGLSRSVQG